MNIETLGYVQPALEGNSINFICTSGLSLIGPNTSTCQNDGHWQPDPRGITCEGDFSWYSL